jgi:hypothetical protein
MFSQRWNPAIATVCTVGLVACATELTQAREVEQLQTDSVVAELSYDLNEAYRPVNPHLTIESDGQVVLDEALPTDGSAWPSLAEIVDLNGDGQLEVIVDLQVGMRGRASLIYGPTEDGSYGLAQRQEWAINNYQLEDLDSSSTPEFIASDQRLSGYFASQAGTAYPKQIWQYRQGELQDVTTEFPEVLRQGAQEMWEAVEDAQAEAREHRGYLAAYLANKANLGEADQAWSQIAIADPAGETDGFFDDLVSVLSGFGYDVGQGPKAADPSPRVELVAQSGSTALAELAGLTSAQQQQLLQLDAQIALPANIPAGFELTDFHTHDQPRQGPGGGPNYTLTYQGPGNQCFAVEAATGGFGGPEPPESMAFETQLFVDDPPVTYQMYWSDAATGEPPYPEPMLFSDWVEGPDISYRISSGLNPNEDCDRISPQVAADIAASLQFLAP